MPSRAPPPDRSAPGVRLTLFKDEKATTGEEFGVSLTPDEARTVFAHLAWAMWEAAEHELIEPGRLSAVGRPTGAVPKPAAASAIIATLRERGTIAATAIEVVRAAKRELIVASYGWDADHEILREICARAAAGVAVTVLARVRTKSMPALLALATAGARVVGYRYLHAKAIVADGVIGVVMNA